MPALWHTDCGNMVLIAVAQPMPISLKEENHVPRVKLILNPHADRGSAREIAYGLQGRIAEMAAQHAEPNAPYQIDWAETTFAGHATELARLAAEEGYDVVVAGGGDGTVHEIVNGLMPFDAGARPTLAILPVGSGNDFAHNIGLPSDPGEAIARLFEGSTRIVDAGRATDGTGRSEYWINTLGAGFGGAMTIISRQITRIHGFAMYFDAVLRTIISRHTAPHMRIQVDGRLAVDQPVTMLSIGNGPREGGGFPVLPNARPDDGVLDWVCIRKVSRLMMLYLLPVVMAARHLGRKQVTHGTGKHIVIDADQEMPIHLDGEIFGSWEDDIRHLEVEVLPAALRVMV
jgi:diacylglycerol kinase (ATP)